MRVACSASLLTLVVACSRNENVNGSARRDQPAATASAEPGPAPGPVAEPSAAAPAGPVGPLAELVSALPVIDGEALLEQIRRSGNKGVIVTAFASWCDPCREELPLLNAAAAKIAQRGVPIWVVSMDEPDAVPAARALLDTLQVTLPAFAAAPPLQAFKIAVNPRWPGMIPASFLFDATGKLRYFWAGEVYEKELVPVVEGFLAGKHIDGTSDFGNAPGATRAGHE
jgi:thiol-disulfide isomerase/thioredoxin